MKNLKKYQSDIKSVVITTIHYPTKMLKSYLAYKDLNVIVIGDKKTPKDWKLKNFRFIKFENQINALGKIIPANCYSRKNIGYLHAMEYGSQWILDTDDDTGILEEISKYSTIDISEEIVYSKSGFVNSFQLCGKKNSWPRGLPLNAIFDKPIKKEAKFVISPIKQFMIAGDADVDAIYRLTNEKIDFKWKLNKSFIIHNKNYCPFNSQATLWNKIAFPLLYIPSTTTMRTSDILRGYVAQRCMREKNWHLAICPGLFFQERNPHDYLNDFEDEIPIYLLIQKIAYELNNLKLSGDIFNDLKTCYKILIKKFQNVNLLSQNELDILDVWIDCLRRLDKWL
jgi:hypothetical protein